MSFANRSTGCVIMCHVVDGNPLLGPTRDARTESRDSLEHVLHVLGVDEGVVDGDDVHHGVLERGAEHQAPDAAEAVDAHRHGADGLLISTNHITSWSHPMK